MIRDASRSGRGMASEEWKEWKSLIQSLVCSPYNIIIISKLSA